VIAEAWLRSDKTGSGRGAARQVKSGPSPPPRGRSERNDDAARRLGVRHQEVIATCLDEQIEFSLSLSRNKRVTAPLSHRRDPGVPAALPGRSARPDTAALICDAEVAETGATQPRESLVVLMRYHARRRLCGRLRDIGRRSDGDRDRRATRTGHEGAGSLMADVVRTVVTKLRQVPRLVMRAELTSTELQATLWIALIVVSAGAVLLLRRRRSAVPRVTDNTPGRADEPCRSRCSPDRCPLNVTDLPFGPDRLA
jgi:hypothetical protein